MYILGHAYVSQNLPSADCGFVINDGMRALMLPDYADSHPFAYEHAWSMDADQAGRLVRSHIAGDWWVHFGDNLEESARRRGWAYLRMGVVSRKYNDFYQEAYDKGLCDSPEPNDSLRGWSHTMMEYSIDTYLARTGRLDDSFRRVREQLGNLAGHADEVCSFFEQQQVRPWSQAVWRHALAYSLRVAIADAPEDFAVLGAVGKFGLDYGAESRKLVLDYQNMIVDEVAADEYETILRAMSDFVHDVDAGLAIPAVPGPPR